MRQDKEKQFVSRSEIQVPADLYQHLLDQGLAKLTSIERRIVRYRFYEIKTISEIANILRISWDEADNSIESAVRKIRSHFKTELASCERPKRRCA